MEQPTQEAVREMLSSTADPAYSVDQQGLLSGWNGGAGRLLGHRRSEVVGRPCHEVLRGRDVFGNPFCEPHCPLLVMARRSEPVRHFQMDVVRRDDDPLRVLCFVLVLPKREREAGFSVIHLLRPVDRPLPISSLGSRSPTGAGGAQEREAPGGDAPGLTPRELEVLGHLAQGETTREVASALHISTSTVRKHVQNLMRKLGVGSRLAAVVTAHERHIL